MKKFILIISCLFVCFISNAQLKTVNQIDSKIVITKVGTSSIIKDPKLGYVLVVKGPTTLYLIELGKTESEYKETIKDLIEIGLNGCFVEATMWGSTMFIFSDILSNSKSVVRFKDPKLHGSAYISIENLEKFRDESTNK